MDKWNHRRIDRISEEQGGYLEYQIKFVSFSATNI